jgi:cell wall-associated NlpC family hydrolase
MILATLALAGCASTSQNEQAESGIRMVVRDSYLSQTKSDPLGAYLASKQFSSTYTNYPDSQYPASNIDSGAKAIANAALDFLGTKYKYGGDTPYSGFDCSGLVIYAAEKSLGLKLPRRSAQIAHEGISIKRSDLKKGDLVFFNTRGHRYSHVGIYLGNEKFVHAPRTGSVVRIEDMNTTYWKKRYNGARRLADSSGNILGLN